MSASPFQLFDILNMRADKVVQTKFNHNQKKCQHCCAYYQRNIYNGIMTKVNMTDSHFAPSKIPDSLSLCKFVHNSDSSRDFLLLLTC